jgi:hypothetical protein
MRYTDRPKSVLPCFTLRIEPFEGVLMPPVFSSLLLFPLRQDSGSRDIGDGFAKIEDSSRAGRHVDGGEKQKLGLSPASILTRHGKKMNDAATNDGNRDTSGRIRAMSGGINHWLHSEVSLEGLPQVTRQAAAAYPAVRGSDPVFNTLSSRQL